MHTNRIRLTFSIIAGLGVLGLAAACGGTVASGTQYGAPIGNAPAGQGNSAATTISVMSVNGGKVLVGPTGSTLYTNDQDTGGKPACVSKGCTAVWIPLTVPAGKSPTTAAGVSGTISTVALADGMDQVTMNGKPLYIFALDESPGQAQGNGAEDTFDGMHFSWHSAVPAGAPAAATSQAPANNIPGY
ncbi:MAG TPA: hypothetical protein VFX16_19770 [Pseudonocardiaceae bacterium]|nr:hypothetical protein [Pseudonocardiaceae bacterium]